MHTDMTAVLPITMPLEPEEWLSSYLLRLVWRNRYRSVHSIHRHVAGPRYTVKWFRDLGTLTQQDPELLIRSSKAFLLSGLDPALDKADLSVNHVDAYSVHDTALRRRLLRLPSSLSYCPDCLGQSSYARLNWLPRVSVVCVIHERLLRSSCPHCEAPVSLMAVAFGMCRGCFGSLSSAGIDRAKIEREVLDSQRILQSWCGPRDSVLAVNPRELPGLKSATQFMFVYGLQDAFRKLEMTKKEHPDSRHESTDVLSMEENMMVGERVARAFNVLQDWPHHFHDFLRLVSETNRQQGDGNAGDGFPDIIRPYVERLWKDESFSFLQEELDVFLVEEYQLSLRLERSWRYRNSPGLRNRMKWVSIYEAARMLGITEKEATKLIANHNVERVASGRAGSGGQLWVPREFIVWLCESFGKETYTLAEAAKVIGTSERVVARLVELGDLLLFADDHLLRGEEPLIAGSSIRSLDSALIDRMMHCIVRPDHEFDSLEAAAARLSRYGIDEAMIIHQALKYHMDTKGAFMALDDQFKISKQSLDALESLLELPDAKLLDHSRVNANHLSVEKRLGLIRSIRDRTDWATDPG